MRPATDRLKVNPPLGSLPALQYCPPAQLQVDPDYQRSLDANSSQTLIRKIAMFWDWGLCQPLVVSRRNDGGLYVVDGQHRLAAAKLRSDIPQLPCVITTYSSSADEAAGFVALNQSRRPLGALDMFRAAVAAGDTGATEVMELLTQAGLTLAPHTNFQNWKPGMVSHIAGIRAAYRVHGRETTALALTILAQAFRGKVLRYGGTIFAGLVRLCATPGPKPIDRARLVAVLREREQGSWVTNFVGEKAKSGLTPPAAAEKVLRFFYAPPAEPVRTPASNSRPAPQPLAVQPGSDGKYWCQQCDARVTPGVASTCKSRFCSLRSKAA